MRNLGQPFNRMPEDRDREYLELEQRLAQEALAQQQSPPLEVKENIPRQNQTGKGWIDKNWVYVPSIDMKFARQRIYDNLNWEETHRLIISQGYVMPTPAQTWELIFYLKDNLDDIAARKVYDDILKTTNIGNWHGELQNAIFSQDKGKMYVQHVKGIKNGKLELTNKKEISNYLKTSGWTNITSRGNVSNQGLCKIASNSQNYEQGKNIYFEPPVAGRVGGFQSSSGWSSFNCNWSSSTPSASLGVRLAQKGDLK